ncbi:MAG: DNA polymerase III subunit beta [Planctomycetota bacterium]
MKVISDRDALLEAINLASGVVASRTPKPQLTCVHLEASTEKGVGRLRIRATDAEVSLTLSSERVDVESAGACLIPADKVRAIVQAEDNEASLSLEAGTTECLIKGQDARFTVFGYAPNDFPDMPTFGQIASGSVTKPKALFTLPAGTLGGLIGRTVFAVARETSRYAINGVLIKLSGKSLEMVATDGRRLAKSEAKLSEPAEETTVCIVPTKALNLLQRLAGDPDEPLHVAVTDQQAVFAFGDADDPRATLATSLVEGTFPPYEEVIPKNQSIKAVFDKDVLGSAVKRAALLTNEESRGVMMAFSASSKKLRLSSRAPEMGESTIDVDLAAYTGDDVEIGFNPAFITDALKVIADNEVAIELAASNKPGLIRTGNEFVYVVMPVNLS